MGKKIETLLLIKLGQNIKGLRQGKNLSQFQLATEAEIPKNQIGRIERAEINTSVLSLYKIAIALEVNIKDLFS